MWGRNYSRENLVKVSAIVIVFLYGIFLQKLDFPRLEALVRDSLQHLNSKNSKDEPFVTINIDIKKGAEKPFSAEFISNFIKILQRNNPSKIVLLLEPRELSSNLEEKKQIFKILYSQPNLYLESQASANSFFRDPVFSRFPRFVIFNLGLDKTFGAMDGKHRRALLSYNTKGPDPIFQSLKDLNLTPKPEQHYTYPYNFWDTKQVLLKSYPVGTFGNYSHADIIDNKISKSKLENKVLLVGAFDEWSYLAPPSVFDLLGTTKNTDFRVNNFPYQDTIANLFNLHINGDYIKLISSVNDVFITLCVLALLAFSNFTLRHKTILFISIIPVYLCLEVAIYSLTDSYVDLSRSIVLILSLHYFLAPVLLISSFRNEEKKRLEVANAARIDALLAVSERIAHDIRSPLSAANLIASKLKFDDLVSKQILSNSLKRIEFIISNILTNYRLDKTLASDTFVVDDSVTYIIREKQALRSLIKYKVTSPELKTVVQGNAIEFERAISNVLDNSIRALERNPDPMISITLSLLNERKLELEIQDNGEGIPEDILMILGLERVPLSKTSGSGIGLLHSKRSIETMGGVFEISSSAKQGAKIRILLNVAK